MRNKRSKISKRDEKSAAKAMVILSSSDPSLGKTTDELQVAEALTVLSGSMEVKSSIEPSEIPSDKDAMPEISTGNIRTESSTQVMHFSLYTPKRVCMY